MPAAAAFSSSIDDDTAAMKYADVAKKCKHSRRQQKCLTVEAAACVRGFLEKPMLPRAYRSAQSLEVVTSSLSYFRPRSRVLGLVD